ncbi:MAG TPA: DUF3606 domain-containing protein [Usitatibacter sp.]|nr:DUF3606 domain-containing protein [Usitatibacter sp.]
MRPKTKDPVDVVDISREEDVRDWAQLFDVTPQELLRAVKAVGTDAERVRDYLSEEE